MVLLFISLYLVSLYLVFVSVKRTLPFFYILFFGVMYFGTVIGLEFDLDSDLFYYALILCFLLVFTITTVIFNLKYSIAEKLEFFKLQPIVYDSKKTVNIFWLLAISSALLTLLYFYLLGYNIFYLVLNDFSAADITTLRVNAYSGETYFAPGYFNQFKNALLPAAITALVINKSKKKKILYYVLTPIAFFGLVGTGQRAFLIFTFLSVLLTRYYFGKLKIRTIVIPSIIVLLIFGAGSFYLGRTEKFTLDSIVGNLLKRVFYQEQHEALITFRYLYEMPITYGYDWYRALIGIFPGVKGSEIQHIVFGLIHGNPRGTAALSFIGSIFHNFGLVGVIVVSCILSLLLNLGTYNFLSNRKNVGNVVLFSYITFYTSMASSGDILFLFNKGVVLFLIISYLIYKSRLAWKI